MELSFDHSPGRLSDTELRDQIRVAQIGLEAALGPFSSRLWGHRLGVMQAELNRRLRERERATPITLCIRRA